MWLNLESLAVGAECRVCNAAVMANDPLRTNRSRVPESELTAPRAARSSLKSSSSTHYMGQDAMAVFAHGLGQNSGPLERLPSSDLGCPYPFACTRLAVRSYGTCGSDGFSTCLSALVTDWAMEAWYNVCIA